jgi:peptide deformylase
VLKQVARPVDTIGAAERALADDLLDTMAESPACVGIAAPQIGESVRAFCVDVTGHKKADSCHGAFVLFNPVLLIARHPESAREGCMSVPDLTGNVARATEVVMQGLDVDGHTRVLEANAFEARALLHELDHLDGMLFLDRVGSVSTDVFRRRRYK